MYEDEQHLRLLVIFHYVVGALLAVVGCFPIFHVGLGLFMLLAPEEFLPPQPATGPQPPTELFPVMGALFVGIGGIIMMSWWIMAICTVLAGRFLNGRRHYLFCMIMAGALCLFMPFGTVLGVLTIIVLMRPSVKALFDLTPPPPAESPS